MPSSRASTRFFVQALVLLCGTSCFALYPMYSSFRHDLQHIDRGADFLGMWMQSDTEFDHFRNYHLHKPSGRP